MPISSQQKKAATRKLVVTPPPLKGRGAPPGGGHVTKAEVLARMKENDAVVVIDGRLFNVDGTPVAPIDKTLAEFLALTPSQVADGAVVHITNVHGPSGVGGVYATRDAVASGWGQNFGTPWCFTTIALAAASFPAASYPGWRFRDTTYNLDYYSDGAEYVLNNGMALVSRSNTAVPTLICPASTFTSPAISNVGGKVLLDTTSTSGGAHGLTSAIAVGCCIYVVGGAGWTVGFHKINAIAVDTTGKTIQLDTAYDAGLGTPTIIYPGSATVVPMLALTVPPLTKNGEIVLDLTPDITNSTNAKNLKIRLNTTEFFAPTYASATGISLSKGTSYVIYNRNDTSIQKASVGPTSVDGMGTSSTACATGTVNTSIATTLNVYYNPSTANERCGIDRYRLSIRS